MGRASSAGASRVRIRAGSWSKGGPGLRERALGRTCCVPSWLVGVSELALTLGMAKATSFDRGSIRFEMLVRERISISNQVPGSRSDENRRKNSEKQVYDGDETPSRSNSEDDQPPFGEAPEGQGHVAKVQVWRVGGKM